MIISSFGTGTLATSHPSMYLDLGLLSSPLLRRSVLLCCFFFGDVSWMSRKVVSGSCDDRFLIWDRNTRNIASHDVSRHLPPFIPLLLSASLSLLLFVFRSLPVRLYLFKSVSSWGCGAMMIIFSFRTGTLEILLYWMDLDLCFPAFPLTFSVFVFFLSLSFSCVSPTVSFSGWIDEQESRVRQLR